MKAIFVIRMTINYIASSPQDILFYVGIIENIKSVDPIKPYREVLKDVSFYSNNSPPIE